MKFTLTFDGELPPNGTPAKKWEIRRHLHPQLQDLWSLHPSLISLKLNSRIPKYGFWHVERHHSVEAPPQPARQPEPQAGDPPKIDLCPEIERGGRRFLPLVRETLALKCGLRIFLRKEDAGRIYQGGDLDNRLKTLFDALSVPQKEQVVPDAAIDDPIYCLLEDDALITGLEISTHRLLSRPGALKHEVRLIIEVSVGVTQSRLYNQAFLGD
jgi:hypothetical protein